MDFALQNKYSNPGISENTFMFYFMMIFVVFGVFFNEIADIQMTDEALEVLLFIYLFKKVVFRQLPSPLGKDIKIFFFLVVFYLGYSLYIGSNSLNVIALDVLLQTKPYIGFFTFYYLAIVFSENQKRKLKYIFLFLFVIALGTLIWSILAYGGVIGNLNIIYQHHSKFYSALIVFGLGYLYCSDFSVKDILMYIFIIIWGLFTLKSKMYGFFVASLFWLFMIKKGFELKISIKNIFIYSFLLFLVLWASREKVLYYFVDSSLNDIQSLARPLLYLTSLNIFMDYFPFGSGFASFATHASRVEYSNIYYKYDLNMIWGLSPEMSDFAADTFYPSLAQFGIVGAFLFILFWVYIVKRLNFYKRETHDMKNYVIGILIITFLGIELVADAAYTNNRGFFMMVLLALVMNEMRFSYENQNKKDLLN